MRRLQRLPLSPGSLHLLRERSRMVAKATDPRAEARRLWEFQDNKTFREIRETLGRMASGLERCMYCEDNEGTAIEHFWPKTHYPERAFDWLNYLLACSRCNSNYKRDEFPIDATGNPLLVNPVEEDPLDHLSFSSATGYFQPLSPKGHPSIKVFGLNRATLTRGRLNAWTDLQGLLVWYAGCRDHSEDEQAARIETSVKEHPFSSVFAGLLRLAAGPNANLLIHPQCLQAIERFPEVRGWV